MKDDLRSLMGNSFPTLLALCCGLAVMVPPAGAQQPLGRLFFTPAQRASLDVARSQRARTALANENTEQEAAAGPQTITYGGLVRRSDGKTTVWINSQPVRDREPAGGGTVVNRVRPDGSVSLQVPQSGRIFVLKPGQSVELLSGTVEEGFPRGTAPRPAPKPGAKPAADIATGKPASPDSARAEREREERQQQQLEEAVARALQETGSAKPGAAPPPAQAPR